MKRMLFILLCLFVVSASVFSAPPPKGSITVAPHGGDYTTITAALDHSVPGDLIVVKKGTYDEAIRFRDGVDIYLKRGVEVNYTGTDGLPTFGDYGFAVTSRVYGEGVISREGDNGNALYVTGNGSNISIDAITLAAGDDAIVITTGYVEAFTNVISVNGIGVLVKYDGEIKLTGDVTAGGVCAVSADFGENPTHLQITITGNITASWGPAIDIADDCFVTVYGNVITEYEGRGGAVETGGRFMHYSGTIRNNGLHQYSNAISCRSGSDTRLQDTRLEVANLDAGEVYGYVSDTLWLMGNVNGNTELLAPYASCNVYGNYTIVP